MKPKVVLVVKYFAPMKRPSGILNFVLNLSDALGKLVDLTVVAWKFGEEVPEKERKENYTIIRVAKPFLLKSALATRKLKPDVVIYGTGIYKIILLIPYYLFFRLFTASTPTLIGQYGTMDNKFGSLTLLLKPFVKGVVSTNGEIDEFYRKKLKDKVTYIPPGVNLEKLEAVKAAKFDFERPIIGFFGHLNENKGSDILYDAFREISPKGTLILAGEGELSEKFQKESQKNIHVYGYLPEILTYIKACDVLVFPFRNQVTILGLSLSAIEALGMGKPLLVTDNPCLSPLVKNGENGYIFKDKEELKKLLQKIPDSDKSLTKMGKKSSLMAKEYGINEIASKYLILIKRANETKK